MENTNQKIIITDKKAMACDGVIDVENLSSDYLTLNTESGQICVEGEDLRIEELSGSDGHVNINGKISGVYFKEKNEKKGIFGRFFK